MKKLIIMFICINIIFVIPIYGKKSETPLIIIKKILQTSLDKDFKIFKEITNIHFTFCLECSDVELKQKMEFWALLPYLFMRIDIGDKTDIPRIKNVDDVINFKQIIKEDQAIVILESKRKKIQYLQLIFKNINGVWINIDSIEKEERVKNFNWDTYDWDKND